jgi:hypothetical protein
MAIVLASIPIMFLAVAIAVAPLIMAMVHERRQSTS